MLYFVVIIFLFSFIWFWCKRKKQSPYVTLHKIKLKNDRYYEDYLRWCLSVGEIPMDKYDFIKEIADKEKELTKLL